MSLHFLVICCLGGRSLLWVPEEKQPRLKCPTDVPGAEGPCWFSQGGPDSHVMHKGVERLHKGVERHKGVDIHKNR